MKSFLRAAVCLVVVLLAITASSSAPTRLFSPFVESWNNLAYYNTTAGGTTNTILLGRFEGKVGLNLFNAPLQIYGVYYGVSSEDKNYWNNAVYSGVGVRFKPFEKYYSRDWQDEWLRDVKIFAETLSSSFFKDIASGEANRRTDFRYGFDVWHEWNLDQPLDSLPWGELYANLSSRSTNFSWTDFNGYLFNFQPKVGMHLASRFEPYLRLDLTASDKSDYWLNLAYYGAGFRFEPWRRMEQTNEFLKKFKMFVEVLNVAYLKNQPPDAIKVSSEVRFGVDFSYGRIQP
ncbi:hypothetical protein HZB08_00955 [Candidatus Saganbacteria bacterium]|uniref:Uncharacterized protein n=1 Tax=Candidatus Saganbacteria bacterium TaxID=2575572 RepID=A0A9D6ULY2_UNCSA|nr:hypothetical protein [Candidatus Saganbacteria bacterium]